jgi:hypothetical protein
VIEECGVLFFFGTLHFVKLSLQAQLAMPMPGSATEQDTNPKTPQSHQTFCKILFLHLYAKKQDTDYAKKLKIQQVFFCSVCDDKLYLNIYSCCWDHICILDSNKT